MSASPVRSLSSQKVASVRNLAKPLVLACFTNEVRSARNSTFFTHLLRISTSVRLTATRVLPVPVAMMMSDWRCIFCRWSHTLRMARF